jgi:hypothetical protein
MARHILRPALSAVIRGRERNTRQILPAFLNGLSIGGEPWAYEQAVITADMELVADAGANTVRIDAHWTDIEASEGVYNWSKLDELFDAANNNGLIPLIILQQTPAWARTGGTIWTLPDDPADYGRFCGAAVRRYRNRGRSGCHLWEIWNEPNYTGFNPTPTNIAAYVALLQAAYTAIRAADPGATVVLGGILRGGTPAGFETGVVEDTHWLEQIYALGGGGYFDAVGYHPYCAPEDPADETPTGADSGDNLIANNGFETNTTGWNVANGAITRVTTGQRTGDACAQVVADGEGQMKCTPPWAAVTPGQVLRLSCWVKAATDATLALQMDWFDAEYGYLSSSYWDQRVCLAGEWAKLGYRATAPESAAYGGCNLRTDGTPAAGLTILVDDAELYVSSSNLHGWNRIAAMRAVMVANEDSAMPLWLTEYGQHIGTDTDAVSEANQAAYITNAFTRAAALDYVDALFIHSHRDTGTDASDKEENYGLVEYDYTPKDAYAAYQAAV